MEDFALERALSKIRKAGAIGTRDYAVVLLAK